MIRVTVVAMCSLVSVLLAAPVATLAGPYANGLNYPSGLQSGDGTAAGNLEQVQYGRGGYGPRGGYYAPRPYYAPRAYGPRAFGPGPAWGYRPWYRRPYYGTIIGGIALGTIVGVTAYGLAPRPPRPDLCWYWADQAQSSGYWDYC